MKTRTLNVDTDYLQKESMNVSEFSKKVIEFGEKLLQNTTNDYGTFYQQTKNNNANLTDILTVGVIWNNCNPYLSIDAIFYAPLFNFLNNRVNNKRLTSINNRLKDNILLQSHNKDINLYQRFEYLSAWIKDNNSFNETSDLFKSWQYWAEQLPLVKQQEIWNKIEEFAKWFTDAVHYYFEELSKKHETLNLSNQVIEKTEFYVAIINELKNEIQHQGINNEYNKNSNLVSA